MEYTGTRFSTTFANGYYQLTGNTGSFVSIKLSDQGAGTAWFSNAGESAPWDRQDAGLHIVQGDMLALTKCMQPGGHKGVHHPTAYTCHFSLGQTYAAWQVRTHAAVSGVPMWCCAGAFCTSSHVVGTGAFVRPVINGQSNPESGASAQFWVRASNACWAANISQRWCVQSCENQKLVMHMLFACPCAVAWASDLVFV
jgi:hypothetical protein